MPLETFSPESRGLVSSAPAHLTILSSFVSFFPNGIGLKLHLSTWVLFCCFWIDYCLLPAHCNDLLLLYHIKFCCGISNYFMSPKLLGIWSYPFFFFRALAHHLIVSFLKDFCFWVGWALLLIFGDCTSFRCNGGGLFGLHSFGCKGRVHTSAQSKSGCMAAFSF